jgi:hypothetical protein
MGMFYDYAGVCFQGTKTEGEEIEKHIFTILYPFFHSSSFFELGNLLRCMYAEYMG